MQDKWVDAQRLIFQHSHNAGDLIVNVPNLMEFANVVSVDGNLVTMGVSNQIYLKKLNEETRLKWVERAISNVTDEKLRIRYVLLGEGDVIQHSSDDELADDPLIQEGLGLGGQIRDDDE